MNKTITISPATREECDVVVQGLLDYNLQLIPQITKEKWVRVELAAKNEKDEIIGGAIGIVGYWGGLDINILWVREEYRGSGVGRSLLERIEAEGRKHEATLSMLSTFDFQALDFYTRNGYTVYAEHHGFPEGHTRYYLEKRFK